jgi:hypothetical protein
VGNTLIFAASQEIGGDNMTEVFVFRVVRRVEL